MLRTTSINTSRMDFKCGWKRKQGLETLVKVSYDKDKTDLLKRFMMLTHVFINTFTCSYLSVDALSL